MFHARMGWLKMSSNCKLILCFYALTILLGFAHGLYEDQIKKFDWGKTHVGKLKNAYLDIENDRILVATEQNVIAALSLRTGAILWRHVLERGPRGNIKLFEFHKGLNSIVAANSANRDNDILVVTGTTPALVRSFASNTGIFQREWYLQLVQSDKAESSMWFAEGVYLYHVVPVRKSHIEISRYQAGTGYSRNTTTVISAPWTDKDCTLLHGYFVCVNYNQIIAIDVTSIDNKIVRREVSYEPEQTLQEIRGHADLIAVGDYVVSLSENKVPCTEPLGATTLHTQYEGNNVFIKYTLKDRKLQFTTHNSESCAEITELQLSVDFPSHYGSPKLLDFACKNRDKTRCTFLITTHDGAVLIIEKGKIKWAREESLADIVATELIDLPLSDAEGAIETELKSKPGDVVGAFMRRISAQVFHIKNTFLAVLGLGLPPTATQKAGLVRDAFGLHKMIVFITRSGKIFGIDNLTGKQHWVTYIPTMTNFNDEQPMQLVIQRTAKHFPHQPICIVLGKSLVNGNGVIYRFNPITGQAVNGDGVNLNYKIKQFTLTHETNNDLLKALLILDHNNNPHVIPEDAKYLANGMYMFTANKQTGVLNGFFISSKSSNLKATQIWKVSLGGYGNSHKIVAVAAKNPIEHVHSQGRVLSDRSVLYKYINPNLVAVVTQAADNIHKYVMNIHLLDVVSGSVVFSMTHRKVRGPLYIVHSENWLVYSYYNDKVRRTEITTVELYEGEVQANGTIWSSLDSPPLPLVEKQSYIFPATIEAMRETITEKGITNKHILIGLANGGIVEMPWALLDPRRPVSMPNQVREEGSIPYIPELPIPTENIINYNQSIPRTKNIYTAPSGLESTCLVVAYGIDLFVTRVSPSKTFDLLKEDFDYFLITVVLIGLTTGSFVVKHLSSRKALKQAWK